jgi:hypothetical protein
MGSQMFGQVVGALYVPLAPQCRDDVPVAQTSVSGTHSPEHRPVVASQTKEQGPA